ncbi:MAG: hypothetical protein GY842_21225, partial [bacterium]|nr:hypothetical protein [bacterium]
DKSVLSVWKRPGGGGFYYGYEGGAGLVKEGKDPIRWAISEDEITQLLGGRWREVLALSRAGRLFGLAGDGGVETLFAGAGTGVELATARRAFAWENRLLFMTQAAAVLHDVERRTYQRIRLPAWLLDQGTELVQSERWLFGLNADRRKVEGAVDLSSLPDGGFVDLKRRLPGATGRLLARPWNDGNLAVIDGAGTVHRIDSAGGHTLLTGPPRYDLTNPKDVLVTRTGLWLASDGGLDFYNTAQRSWIDREKLGLNLREVGEEKIEGLTLAKDQLLARIADGRLINLSSGETMIGDADVLGISDATLSDAMHRGSHLYLAGEGAIVRYNMVKRRSDRRWKMPAGVEDVDLLDFHLGEPIALAAGKLWLGESRSVSPGAGKVLAASVDDGWVWTVRQEQTAGERFLMGHPLREKAVEVDAPRCFFRNPRAPTATSITDARRIDSGWIAVLHPSGLDFYSEEARSWHQGPQFDASGNAARLYRLGEYLAWVTGGNGGDYRVGHVAISQLPKPDSCSTASFSPDLDPPVTAQAVAVNEKEGAIAWIDQGGGGVDRWQAGQKRTVLVNSGNPPDPGTFRRVFVSGNRTNESDERRLLFTTADCIWSYELKDHSWRRIRFMGWQLPSFESLNLEPAEGGHMVTATHGRDSWIGFLPLDSGEVPLKAVALPAELRFPHPGEQIVDVVKSSDGHWIFVLEDRLKTLDPEARTWLPDIIFPTSDRSR